MKRDDDADALPSAKAMVALEALTKKKADKRRAAEAWRLVTGAASNPDFHAVLDFARENELVLPCEQTDPTAANLTWTNPIDGSEMVWIPAGKFVYGTQGKTAECAGFSLARRPVTNAQFTDFISELSYWPENALENGTLISHCPGGVIPKGKEQHPVTFVSLF